MEGSTLPTYVTEAFTTMTSQAEALMGQAWPVLVLVFGGAVLMKLFKKFGNKAT